MPAQLSKELSDALLASGTDAIEVVDPQTQRVYVICDAELHRNAKRILDREAIHDGIQQMRNGDTQPLDAAFDEMRSRLGLESPQ